MVKFFQTQMGRQYYEGTLPELVVQLTRLNAQLARHNVLYEEGLRVCKRAESDKVKTKEAADLFGATNELPNLESTPLCRLRSSCRPA
jgi:hypothetical protein